MGEKELVDRIRNIIHGESVTYSYLDECYVRYRRISRLIEEYEAKEVIGHEAEKAQKKDKEVRME